MKNILFFISILIASSSLSAQQWLMGIETSWSDSFVEWEVYTEDEEAEGKLELRWKNQLDWSAWEYDIDGERGQIQQASAYKPDEWELRDDNNHLITIRPKWRNDMTEWKITNNDQTFIFRSRWRNNRNEWELKNDTYGQFNIRAAWDDDPRRWNIYDELNEDIPLSFKMAMVFVATFYSSPKQ